MEHCVTFTLVPFIVEIIYRSEREKKPETENGSVSSKSFWEETSLPANF